MTKYIKVIHAVNSCYECPFHSGGDSLGSAMYCRFPEDRTIQIFDENGDDCAFIDNTKIAWFCKLYTL